MRGSAGQRRDIYGCPGEPTEPVRAFGATGSSMPATMAGVESAPDRVVLADREHRFAPPPWRMHDALATEVDEWLRLRPREMQPEILAQVRPEFVRWGSLWPISPHDEIEFRVRPDGAGSAVRVLWTSTKPPDERGINLVRHHLNEVIAGDLRFWVDRGYARS